LSVKAGNVYRVVQKRILSNIYHSVNKYHMNIWYAPNCRATLNFF